MKIRYIETESHGGSVHSVLHPGKLETSRAQNWYKNRRAVHFQPELLVVVRSRRSLAVSSLTPSQLEAQAPGAESGWWYLTCISNCELGNRGQLVHLYRTNQLLDIPHWHWHIKIAR